MNLKTGLGFLLMLLTFKVQAVTVFVGHTLFYVPGANMFSPYTEVYWEIDAATLNFENTDKGWLSKIKVDVAISADTGLFSEDHFILQTPAHSDKAAAAGQMILDLHRYKIPSGRSKMKITFTELSSTANTFTFTDTLSTGSAQGAFASGLQLLDTAYAADIESPFLRSGMQHVPICLPFIDDFRKSLNYYFELYGLDREKGEGPFILKSFISKKINENPLTKFIRTDTIQPAQVVPRYGSFPVAALPSGNYYLNTAVYNMGGDKLASNWVFFQRANKKAAANSAAADTFTTGEFDTTGQKNIRVFNIAKTFVAKYSHAQLKAILKMLLPISDATERQNINGFIKNPDEMYTRYFIYNFWLNRNADKPEKAWEAYADKVREVNNLFRDVNGTGYETDRGYVYLKYGKPNERIVVGSEPGALPYEVWQYFTVKNQGQDGVFLFYKPGNVISDFRLLHSTVTGEAKDMTWRRSLYPNGAGDQSNSKAEQYLRNR